MLQAQMIRTNGRYTYKYSDSKTDAINLIIISQDYERNKELLFSLSLNGYMAHYQPLHIQYKLTNVISSIIQNLTTEERAILSCAVTKTVSTPPTIPEIPLEGKTFYVITTTVGGISYFIFKNYSTEDFIIPTYTYTFDVSHPSNAGTKLEFSFIQGGPRIDYVNDSNPKLIKVTLPSDVSYNQLYPYDAAQNSLYLRYNTSGYTVGSIYIKLSAFAQSLIASCNPTFYPISTPNLYVYNNNSYELIYLTASSVLYVYENNGPNISISDINSRSSAHFTADRKFGLSVHEYYLYIPQTYPIALLNSTQKSNIRYKGDDDKVIKDVLVLGTEDDDLYDFYYGTIKITVTGSFQPISIYTLNYGYIHGKSILVYAENPNPYFDTNPYILPY